MTGAARQWLLLLAAFLCGLLPLTAQNTRRQESRKARLQEEIRILNRQLSANASSSSQALGQLQLARRQVAARRELLAESDREIRALDDSIRRKEQQIALLQQRNDTLSAYYGRLVRGAYKNRNPRLWYMYILASDNLSQAWHRFGYLRSFSREMRTQALALQESAAALEVEMQQLSALRDEAVDLRERRAQDMAVLQGEEDRAVALVDRLQKDRTRYQKELEKKNREVEALNREIAEIIRRATAPKASSSSSKGSTAAKGGKSVSSAVDTRLSGAFSSNKGKLPWPVEGTVVESFGQHEHPVYKNVKLPFNNGVTVAVNRGAAVRAVYDGEVSQVVVMPGYSHCVLVRHGSYFTFYCKLRDVTVKAGDKVATGTVLGTVETIGGEDLMHFQLWKDRTPQNPEQWLR